MAAIADPPQIPVPEEIKLDKRQSSPNNFPSKYPPPNAAIKVKTITINENLPASRIVVIFKLAPNKIIANFKTRLETNITPSSILEFSIGLK